MLKKVLLAILDNFEGYVSQVLLAFFVLILLLQIFLRQFGHPLYWTEELARYSFVWFVFFGASYAARLAAHNSGKGAKYTRGRGPVELVYREACGEKSAALRREAAIKKLSRQEKLRMIRQFEECKTVI